MMPRLAVALVALSVFGLPLPGLAQDPDRAARFIAEVRANGCMMTETEADRLLAAAGFTQQETGEIAGVLLEAGLAALSEDWSTLRLDAGLCAADPAGDAAAFADALASLPGDLPPPGGPDPEELAEILREALGLGFVRATMELAAEGSGCVIDLSDPATARRGIETALLDYLRQIYGLPDGPLPGPAARELDALIDGFLADPGPFFDVEPDRLVLQGCAP